MYISWQFPNSNSRDSALQGDRIWDRLSSDKQAGLILFSEEMKKKSTAKINKEGLFYDDIKTLWVIQILRQLAPSVTIKITVIYNKKLKKLQKQQNNLWNTIIIERTKKIVTHSYIQLKIAIIIQTTMQIVNHIYIQLKFDNYRNN